MDTDAFSITLFGLGAAVGWGVANFIAAQASRKLGGMTTALLINVIGGVLFSIIYVLWLHPTNSTLTLGGATYAIAGGVFIAAGAVAFFSGLRIGPVSLVSPLSGTYPLVTTLIAAILFGATFSNQQVLGILLIVLGALGTAEIIQRHTIARSIAPGPRYALITAVLWGTGYALIAQSVVRLGWETASFVEFIAIALAFACFLHVIRKHEGHTPQDIIRAFRSPHILTSGTISLGAALLLSIGMSREQTSGALIAALSACYPAITIVLALRHFKEEVKLVPLVGAAISIAGVICITLS